MWTILDVVDLGRCGWDVPLMGIKMCRVNGVFWECERGITLESLG